MLYSNRGEARAAIDSDQFSDDGRFFTPPDETDAPRVSYWPLVERLSRAQVALRHGHRPGRGLRANDLTAAALARYTTVVVPDCWAVSAAQHQALLGYLDAGGRVLLHGAYGTELGEHAAGRTHRPAGLRGGGRPRRTSPA